MVETCPNGSRFIQIDLYGVHDFAQIGPDLSEIGHSGLHNLVFINLGLNLLQSDKKTEYLFSLVLQKHLIHLPRPCLRQLSSLFRNRKTRKS